MEFEDLNYDISKINPSLLLSKDKDLDDFFFKLGLFFNDIKSCVNLIKIIKKQSKGIEINSFSGELGGINSMLEKTMLSYIHEFLEFIYKKRDLIGTVKFQLIIKDIDKIDHKLLLNWKYFYDLSIRSKNLSLNDIRFRNILSELRDNSFHYHNDMTDCFIKYFLENKKENYNEYCYYSFGENVGNTRFFYCDALMRQELMDKISEINKIKDQTHLIDTTFKLLEVVAYFMKSYFIYLKIEKK